MKYDMVEVEYIAERNLYEFAFEFNRIIAFIRHLYDAVRLENDFEIQNALCPNGHTHTIRYEH